MKITIAPIPAADLEAVRITSIKQAAGKLILSRYGILNGKQANMQKQGLKLTRKRAMGLNLTSAEIAEELELLAADAWIDSVRAESNAAELIAGKQATDIVWPI